MLIIICISGSCLPNRKVKIHIGTVATRSSYGSVSNGTSVLGDHAPGGDHHCSVDTDVSARPGLFSGMYGIYFGVEHRLVVLCTITL